MTDAVSSAIKKTRKGRKAKGKKGKKAKKVTVGKKKGKNSLKYDSMSAKEMYQLVKQKRDVILEKRGIPAKLPRGKAALIEICKKIKALMGP